MKISLNWLSHWIKDIPANLEHQLTMAGLEVDSISEAAPKFSGVVVGEVKTLAPHPDADKLRVAMVDVGQSELLQIVCGAPNVAPNIKVPVAMIGAVLPNDFKIKASKLRGVDSAGMLCSALELGISEDHSGLMILPNSLKNGEDFRAALALDDTILEIDLTPNRGDCLSMIGVAREVAAINGFAFPIQPIESNEIKIKADIKVKVEAPKDCPRYLARVIKSIKSDAQTPLWMQEALRRADVRPHNLLVDVTNYVLLELGQPMHAFDLDKIQGNITVRRAQSNESLELLNGDKIALNPSLLMITDEQGPIALAGIMGGGRTACSDDTQNILLESAWFNPLCVAGKARDFGLQTDASHRYERGVDFELPLRAIERATQLLIELGGAEASNIITVESLSDLPQRAPITVSLQKINKLIGFELSATEVKALLMRIDPATSLAQDKFVLTPPSYRFDLAIEEDLIEEVARLYGYDNIPTITSKTALKMGRASESIVSLQRFKELLISRDYMEAISMSFVKPEWLQTLTPACQPILLKNPISSDLSAMRTTLLAGLLKSADYNLKRQQKRVRLFESGLIFVGDKLETLQQIPCLGGVICGDLYRPEWGNKARKVDFFDIKGDVGALLMLTGKHDKFRFVTSKHPALHPGQAADILNEQGENIGFVGTIHPNISKALDLNVDTFVFELKLPLLSQSYKPIFNEISRFPFSKRDLALIVPNNIATSTIIDTIKASDKIILNAVELFDIYQDNTKLSHSKSMAFSLYFQSLEENLKDSEIDNIIANVLDNLKNLNITLRQ